jgi:hypothetical protein
MHPDSARQLKHVMGQVFTRAGGSCEACGARAPLAFSCAIDGLPTEDQALALCERCRPTIETELGLIAKISELEQRIAEIRKR